MPNGSSTTPPPLACLRPGSLAVGTPAPARAPPPWLAPGWPLCARLWLPLARPLLGSYAYGPACWLLPCATQAYCRRKPRWHHHHVHHPPFGVQAPIHPTEHEGGVLLEPRGEDDYLEGLRRGAEEGLDAQVLGDIEGDRLAADDQAHGEVVARRHRVGLRVDERLVEVQEQRLLPRLQWRQERNGLRTRRLR